MKIVSLLPSATEIVFALGLGDALEGVTSDCDYPAGARSKPAVSVTALSPTRTATLSFAGHAAHRPSGSQSREHSSDARTLHLLSGANGADESSGTRLKTLSPDTYGTALSPDIRSTHLAARTAGAIDEEVRTRLAAGEPLYRLDAALISAIAPDLILTQDLCRVCAVPTGDVEDALDLLGCSAEVVSLDPSTLDDVIACIERVGDATGTSATARVLTNRIRDRIGAVRQAVSGLDRPRTFGLEWSDPPFSAGHWVPDMIEAAGGAPVLVSPGVPSRRLAWQHVAAEAPEVVVFMPCGYDLPQAVAEGSRLLTIPALATASRIFAADGSAYFSRPGPRIADGIEALAWALHPDAALTPRPDAICTISH